ncbi:MAG: SDR family NAD(P)-dependent oxidoreductase [Deltaproteobacteria bacterium]|nr:SDR family NAD(P)-dependent oxidoreductase [Deltaproteobacteria bacterium]
MNLPLHILLNNAGLAAQQGLTDDGFELAFGVNHLGPALFTRLLEEKLKESAPSRVVFVASDAHRRAKGGIDFSRLQQSTQTTSGFPEYAVSKLANLLHSRRLGLHLKGSGVTTYSLHPGVVATDVWRRIPSFLSWILKLFMISADEGAKTSVYCCTDEGLASESGKYYQKNAVCEPNFHGHDDDLMQELWDKTENWLAPFL